MKPKNIILINPVSTAVDCHNKVTPLGLCCIAGVLLRSGHNVKICDMNIGDRLSRYDIWSADYIGFTATTPVINDVYAMANKMVHRKVKAQIVIGGAHVTAMQDVLDEQPYNICICIGEGDYYIDNMINGENRKIESLDELPYPAYHLLNASNYVSDIVDNNPYATIETSRGCYAKCIYCNRKILGNKMRFKSARRVVNEMLLLKFLGYREIHIMDDNFTADINRAKNICQLMIDEKVGLSWIPRTGIRIDRIDEELLTLMRDSGCYKVFYGVESGSQRILDIIKKGITLEQVENSIRLAKKVGIKTGAYYMMGLPGETIENLDKTIKFALKLNTDSVNCGIALPLPGTEFFEYAKKHVRIKTFDWSKYTFSENIYEHENLSEETIEKYLKKFFRKYYLRHRYILRKLFSKDVFKNLSILIKTINRLK